MVKDKIRGYPGKSNHQSGIALVSVLGAIAIITAIAVSLTYRQQIDISVQGYAIQKNAIILKVLAVESLAEGILTRLDSATDSAGYDHYEESWARPVVDLDLGGTRVNFIIFDAQAKYNVNNVNVGGNARAYAQTIMSSLIMNADIGDNGQSFVNLVQWLYPAGNIEARDQVYMQEANGFARYRVSLSPMASLDELRLISSLRDHEDLPEIIENMDEYMVALPTVGEFVKLNVNTASDGALRGALEYFRAADALLPIKQSRPYSSVNQICGLLNEERRNNCGDVFTVRSSYYYVVARMEIGDNQVFSRSLLRLTGDSAVVVTREVRVV